MDVIVALILFSLTYIFLIIAQWAIARHKSHQILKRCGIPGPKPNFFSGNMYDLKKEATPNNIISSWIKKYGNIFGYYMGGIPFVVIKDLDALRKVLIKDFDTFTNRPIIYLTMDSYSRTFANLKDMDWKEVRNIMTPMLTSGKIKLTMDIISGKVDTGTNLVLKKIQNGEIVDMYDFSQRLTLDVIAAVVLSTEIECQENEKDVFFLAVKEFLLFLSNKANALRIMFPFIANALKLSTSLTNLEKSSNLMLFCLKNIVKQRKYNLNPKCVDVLQALMEKSTILQTDETKTRLQLTELDVIANALLVLLAGYETSAGSLAFTFHLLMKHPEIQNCLYEEIRDIDDVSYSSIQSLKYLDQVLNESLRMYPPSTGFIARYCKQEYQLGASIIPKGAHVVVPVWDIHHDPELWPDPWKFDPERFSPSNKSSIKNMSYLPFGAGPRNCIGGRFAQLFEKIVLFKVLKMFKLESCEKTIDPMKLFCTSVLTLPAHGVWIRAVPRS